MRYAVLGAGSMGSLFAGRLAASGAAVTLVGRGEHFDHIAASGLTLVEPDGKRLDVTLPTARSPSELDGVDALVLCVKAYDTATAVRDATPLLDAETDVVSLQNGLGNAESIAQHTRAERVVVGTTSHGASVESPGVVRHAGVGDTVLGRFFAANDSRVREYAAALSAAGIETTVTDDPKRAVWEKVLVNAGINPVTALADVDNGALVDGPAERVLERAVREGVHVAAATGVEIDPAVAVDAARAVAAKTAENTSSMRQDRARGTQTEIEALNGELARRGDEHGVPTPVNATLADLVRTATQGAGSDGRGQS